MTTKVLKIAKLIRFTGFVCQKIHLNFRHASRGGTEHTFASSFPKYWLDDIDLALENLSLKSFPPPPPPDEETAELPALLDGPDLKISN